MKTYILDTLNRYNRFSENLDVKATLCNKSWQVFNDAGEKEVYIFQEDGTLIISLSGRVTNANWQYIPANKSLIISSKQQSFMVHPAFMDNVVFALQVDGTKEYSFLIDESNTSNFKPKCLEELKQYFKDQERKMLEEQEEVKEVVKQSTLRKDVDELWLKHKEELLKQYSEYSNLKKKEDKLLIGFIVIFIMVITIGISLRDSNIFIFFMAIGISLPILIIHTISTTYYINRIKIEQKIKAQFYKERGIIIPDNSFEKKG